MLAGDTFMAELHLRQPGFTYSGCGPFKHFRETGNLKHELNKACFAHDAVCSDSEDLAKRTVSDKVLKDRADEIAKIPSMMDIKEH